MAALQPRLRPRYVAAIEERVYIEVPAHAYQPDVSIRHAEPISRPSGGAATVAEVDAPLLIEGDTEVHEPYLEILDLHGGRQIVAVIEVLSPTNKYAGPGRDSYLAKQREVLQSTTHLVEIDLLRHGPHVLAVPEAAIRDRATRYDYLICVARAGGSRHRFEVYPRALRLRLPRIGIPLAGGDPDVPLDIQALLERVYEAGAYADRIDYRAPCEPPLSPQDQRWADEMSHTPQ
jgi:hypothetical protein